ncbi:rab proteins geranylgeranyltransferase component A [Drosophila willistoni]|nr:rab proteins geranylgeranyltransferase component A [Drosophila willistoni]
MTDELPEAFDLVVMGTGFTESCIAAAASRIGKTVLHLDKNEYYGGDSWGYFSLDALCSLLEKEVSESSALRNGSYTWHNVAAVDGDTDAPAVWTREAILAKSRRFNLDLCPRVLYAAGELVQLLIRSNICRYAEFRAVDHVCMNNNGEILSVPCSRSDVFNTKILTMVEKRLLMKFLMACNDYGEDKCNEDSLAFRGRSFVEYLQAQRVTEKIASCVMQSIAMCGPNSTFEKGMQRTQRFLSSLGRYGNTPFLFPMYGCGELPQCFCRLCAVFGGIYCLKRSVDAVNMDSQSQELLVSCDGKTLRAKHLVSAPGQVPINPVTPMRPNISRGLFISCSPLGNEEINKGGGGVNLLRLLADGGAREAIVIQLSHYSGACPEGLYIFHITTPAQSEDPIADLAPFTSQIFQSISQIVFSSHFTLYSPQSLEANALPLSIHCTSGPIYEIDYDAAISEAHRIFMELYPTEVFLPRAPDPEEIVIDGEDPSALNEHSLPEDLRAQLHDMELNSTENQ